MIEPRVGRALAAYARAKIEEALGGRPAVLPDWMHKDEPGAAFVTVHRAGRLQGCIGTLEPQPSLVESVGRCAVTAALHDPRGLPLTLADLRKLHVEVSVLGPLSRMDGRTEQEIVRQLRPGRDGVVLRYREHEATFLPQVWRQLPEPERFLAELKRKAGLPADFWHRDVIVERYAKRSYVDAEGMSPSAMPNTSPARSPAAGSILPLRVPSARESRPAGRPASQPPPLPLPQPRTTPRVTIAPAPRPSAPAAKEGPRAE